MKKSILFNSLILDFKSIILTLKRIGLFEEYRRATNNARLFMILIRHREIKMISDANKNTEVTLI